MTFRDGRYSSTERYTIHDAYRFQQLWTGEPKTIVPAKEFKWARREKLDHARLSDFISVKMQDAFFAKQDGYFAMTSRNATVKNFRVLKKKGMVNWICTPNQYTRLLEIACEYRLLHVYEEHVRPTRRQDGRKVLDGKARVIGPGAALRDERDRFLPLYAKWKHSVNACKSSNGKPKSR